MCEHRTIKVVLDDDFVRHKQECMDNYWDGFWRGVALAFGIGIAAGGVIAKLASSW